MTETMKLKDTPWKQSFDKSRLCIKKQRHHFGFSSSYVRMWDLDHKEGWELKN